MFKMLTAIAVLLAAAPCEATTVTQHDIANCPSITIYIDVPPRDETGRPLP